MDLRGWPELLGSLPAEAVVAESDQAVVLGPDWDVIKQQRYAGTVVVIASRRSNHRPQENPQ